MLRIRKSFSLRFILVLPVIFVVQGFSQSAFANPTTEPKSLNSGNDLENDKSEFASKISDSFNVSVVFIDALGVALPCPVNLTHSEEAFAKVIKENGGEYIREGRVIKVYKASTGHSRFGAPGKSYSGKLISVDLQDTSLENALRIIEGVSNKKILKDGIQDLEKKVTLRLLDVPWDQVLDLILEKSGFVSEFTGDHITVKSRAPNW